MKVKQSFYLTEIFLPTPSRRNKNLGQEKGAAGHARLRRRKKTAKWRFLMLKKLLDYVADVRLLPQ